MSVCNCPNEILPLVAANMSPTSKVCDTCLLNFIEAGWFLLPSNFSPTLSTLQTSDGHPKSRAWPPDKKKNVFWPSPTMAEKNMSFQRDVKLFTIFRMSSNPNWGDFQSYIMSSFAKRPASKSTITQRGTCLPAPVSEKNLRPQRW